MPEDIDKGEINQKNEENIEGTERIINEIELIRKEGREESIIIKLDEESEAMLDSFTAKFE